MDVIVTHTMADFDALASLVAAKKLYPKAQMVLPASLEKNVRDYLAKNQERFDFFKEKEIDLEKVKRLIIVDTRLSSRIGILKNVLDNPHLNIHLYDHHPRTEKDLKGKIDLGDKEGATTTLLVERIREKKIKLNSGEATLFALGIYEDTGCLTFTSTTVYDLKAVSFLLTSGADLNIISSFIHPGLSPSQIKLLEKLLHSVQDIMIENVKVTISATYLPSFKDDLAIVVHKLRDIEDVNILFVLVKIKERIHLIARAQRQDIVSVGEFVRFFGGGGHETAASATIYNYKLSQIKKELISIVREKIKINKGILPIKEVPYTMKISKVMQVFSLKANYDLLLVTRKGKPIGIITRKDMEKAEHYGFGDFPVSTFMYQEGEGRNFTEFLLKSQQRKPTRNVGELIMKKLPRRVRNLLKKIGQIGDEMNCSVYIVGGFIRDLFLGVENFDIDIVVEGNGISFAHRLASCIGEKLTVHTKFSTAVIDVNSDLKIDIATARSEVYEYPGALPKVKLGRLKEDLYRRDFSVNAMAVKLNSSDFGTLIDFFNGEEDLEKGIVRILYNLSFIEDPTRIFRAIRFEQRYDFKMDKNTDFFLRWTVKNNFLKQISKERIREEIISILNESEPEKVIRQMAGFKILRYIHPRIKMTTKIWKDFKELKDVLFLFTLPLIEDEVKKWLIYFLVLIQDLNLFETTQVCDDLKFNKKLTGYILMTKEVAFKIKRKLKKKKILPNFIYQALHKIPNEVILFAMIRSKDKIIKKRISDYLTKMRQVRIFTNGDDLKRMGYREGKAFKEIKKKLLYAKLDGVVKTRKEEIKFVVDNFPKD